MLKHKGYVGVLRVDTDAGVLRGRVVNTRDMITFQGQTVEEARREFVESVEDYLEFCASRGEEPEKPFSGQFPVRTKPSLHRALATAAAQRGISLNEFVNRLLSRATKAEQRHISKGKAIMPTKASQAKTPRQKKISQKK